MSARNVVVVFITTALAASLIVLAGCSGAASGGPSQSASSGLAAYGDDFTITEDEVTDYTQRFRQVNNLVDDASWAAYLQERGKTGSTWREGVIREKADRILIERKAEELGIKADEAAVADKIESAKKNAGIDPADDAAWQGYLAERGQTPDEVRDAYEFSSVEQQVFSAELDLTSSMKDEMGNDYIKEHLADQVVRHYYALGFDLDDEAGARAVLDELKGLSGPDLAERFLALCDERGAGATKNLDAGSIGWDFMFDNFTVDPNGLLRKAKLAAGDLYGEPLKGADEYRVVLCVEREELVGDKPYESINSDSLKPVISDLALTSHWAALFQQYVSGLEEKAHVQVTYMPEGLPYDVTE